MTFPNFFFDMILLAARSLFCSQSLKDTKVLSSIFYSLDFVAEIAYQHLSGRYKRRKLPTLGKCANEQM